MHRVIVMGIAAVAAVVLAPPAFAQGAAAKANLFPAPIYVTLQASDAVEVFPSGRVFKGIPGAHFDAVNRAGTLLLVSSATTPDAYLVDTHSGKTLATFAVGPMPQGVAFSPDRRFGLATSSTNGTVSVIDVARRKVVKTIKVGRQPWGVGFAPDGKRAYVALQGGAAVAVIDPRTWTKTGEIAVPGVMPHAFDFSADGKVLWVRGLVGNLAAVDLASRKVLAVITVGPSHAGVVVVPHGRYVFTGGIGGDDVDVVDPATRKVIRQIDVGRGPHDVAASPDGRWVYAGVTVTGKLVVIDARTQKVVAQIPVDGTLPMWIAVAGGG